MATLTDISQAAAPTEADARLARESSRRLARLFHSRRRKKLQLRVRAPNGTEEIISIPGPAFKLFSDLLNHLAKGNGVALIPLNAEVTTQQAADLLNISRPFLIEQLDKGLIPFRKVGSHRRIFFRDLKAFKQRMDRGRLKALDQLSALDQELGLGY